MDTSFECLTIGPLWTCQLSFPDHSLKPGYSGNCGRNLVAQIRRWSQRVECPVHDLVAILKETPDLLEELRIVRLQGSAKDQSTRFVEQSRSSH